MKTTTARAVTYAVVTLLVVVALRFTPPLPTRKPVARLLRATPAASALPNARERFDTLGRGESLHNLLTRGGISESDADRAMRAATTLDPRRIPAGMPVTLVTTGPDSAPAEIVLQLAIDRLLRLRRTAAGWVGAEERLPWTTDTIVVAGVIWSNLYQAMDSSAKAILPAAARQQLTWTLADVFEYRVDMSRDLQEGDAFRVIAERLAAPSGAVRIGKILAASLTLSGTETDAVRYTSQAVSGDFFDQTGRSLRAAFLRAPLEFRRISSVFGMREHPILGLWRRHKGTDYAAASGTPVRAIGDGVVLRAGWAGGYGNLLEIRHKNGFVTRYGHLRAFAHGIHAGSRVAIGTTVAYVGATGLATGPHLHFEVLIDGVQHDARTALRTKGGEPVPPAERVAFASVRDRMVAALAAPTSLGAPRLATR